MTDNQSKIYEIRIPQLGVNDEYAKLVEWLIKDRSKVSKGDPICVLETSKVTTEIAAEQSGYLIIRSSTGEDIKINDIIGYIAESPEIQPTQVIRQLAFPKEPPNPPITTASINKTTSKARQMANSFGLDINMIKTKGYIREKDVVSHLSNDNNMVAIYGAGAGGFTLKECIDLGGIFKVAFFIDDDPKKPKYIQGIPVIKGDQLETLIKNKVMNIACAIANAEIKMLLKKKLEKLGFNYINVIHPKSYISPTAKLGTGNYIKAGAIVETNTVIGNCCIIDNGVAIAHDNKIGDGCHLAPGVTLGSNIEIGEQTIVGIGASISTNINIGKKVIVSVGSSVTHDIPDNTVIEGVPGKIIGTRK